MSFEKAKPIKIQYSSIICDDNTKLLLAKCENAHKTIKQLRPFKDLDMLSQIKSFYKTECVWSSEALEGNSISKGETQVMIEEGVTVEGHPLRDILRTTGHAEAFDEIFEMMENPSFSIRDIIKLHSIIMGKERPDIAGKYKTKPNIITGSEYTTIPPRDVPDKMDRFDEWLQKSYGKEHPILLAAEVHRKLVYIHPFTDGNGRTARLAMNAILIQNGYLPISISPYLKMNYNSALELGRQGNLNAFYEYISEAEYETEKEFCRYMNIKIPTVSQKEITESIKEFETIQTSRNNPDDTPPF